MGKILPFEKSEKPRYLALQDSVSGILPELEKTFATMGIELDPTIKIQAHLSGLRGGPSRTAVATARMGLREVDKDVLLTIARTTNHHQWSARPGYFQALVDEIRSRQ